MKAHCGLHDEVQLIDGIVSPSVTVYVVVGGDSITDSSPSIVIFYRSNKNNTKYKLLYIGSYILFITRPNISTMKLFINY